VLRVISRLQRVPALRRLGVIRVIPTAGRSLPVYTDKQTSWACFGMSQRCQEATLAADEPSDSVPSEIWAGRRSSGVRVGQVSVPPIEHQAHHLRLQYSLSLLPVSMMVCIWSTLFWGLAWATSISAKEGTAVGSPHVSGRQRPDLIMHFGQCPKTLSTPTTRT
jgi:hypothetical protein